MKKDEAQRAIAAITWANANNQAPRKIVGEGEYVTLSSFSYLSNKVKAVDGGKLFEAELGSSRFYGNYESDTQKILFSNVTRYSFQAEDRQSGLVYQGSISGNKVTLQNASKTYEYEVS